MRSIKLFAILAILVLLIFVVFLVKQNVYYQGCDFYSGIMGSILGAFFAAFLVFVAWEELGNLGKTSSADFIHRLKADFFQPQTRTVTALLECDALEFKANSEGQSDPFPYFEIKESVIEETDLPEPIKKSLTDKKYYSCWEIDELILGHFEDIGMFEQRGILDFQMVYDEFSWYLEIAWNNDQIRKYINRARDEYKAKRIENAFYYYFQYIAIKCNEYEDLYPGFCLKWWKFKRRFFCGPKLEMNDLK
ncbi:MAG: hypothetical protein ACP5SH_21220 [Syntrophobacteraceae bacterium]